MYPGSDDAVDASGGQAKFEFLTISISAADRPSLLERGPKVRIRFPPPASPVRTSPPRAPVSFARRQLRKSAIAPSGERERRIGLQNDRDRRGLGDPEHRRADSSQLNLPRKSASI